MLELQAPVVAAYLSTTGVHVPLASCRTNQWTRVCGFEPCVHMQVEIREFIRPKKIQRLGETTQCGAAAAVGGPLPQVEEQEELIQAVIGVNTEIAEQTFKELRASSPTLRMMGVWSSKLLLAFRVHWLNVRSCRRQKATVVANGPIATRWQPCSTLGPTLHFV